MYEDRRKGSSLLNVNTTFRNYNRSLLRKIRQKMSNEAYGASSRRHFTIICTPSAAVTIHEDEM